MIPKVRLSPQTEMQLRHRKNAALVEHRLGATADQFVGWYGAPQDSPGLDKNFPLLQGAIHHTYDYKGWRIRVAFLGLDGPAVRMEYSKIIKPGVNATIQDYELKAIMTANTPPGTTWKEIAYNNPDSLNKGLSKIFESYFGGAMGERDAAPQRRRDLMVAQQNHCPA